MTDNIEQQLANAMKLAAPRFTHQTCESRILAAEARIKELEALIDDAIESWDYDWQIRCKAAELALADVKRDRERVLELLTFEEEALDAATKALRRETEGHKRHYCDNGRRTCEECVGSCGIEEHEELIAALAATEDIIK